MKILFFNTSPNKEGNDAQLVHRFIEGVGGAVEVINAYDAKVNPCRDCRYCKNHVGKCVIEDEMTEIYKKIEASDVIGIAAPMYFGSFPAPMKNIIDRAQMFWAKNEVNGEIQGRKRRGILFITAGAEWDNMFTGMETVARYFFKVIGVELKDKLYVSNTDKIKISENVHLMEKAQEIGRQLAKFTVNDIL